MIDYNIDRARDAVQYLVTSPYFAQHIRKIVTNVENPSGSPFEDDLSILNELVVVGRQNRKALDNLLQIVHNKRSDKADYQREFMAAKRKRDRKVVHLEEAVTGRALNLDERRELLLKQYVEWNAEREKLLSTLTSAEWDERNAALREFWQRKEEALDQMLMDLTAVNSDRKK
jgi:Arc/MetJ family transcription regulator